jgi:hypothetical protein
MEASPAPVTPLPVPATITGCVTTVTTVAEVARTPAAVKSLATTLIRTGRLSDVVAESGFAAAACAKVEPICEVAVKMAIMMEQVAFMVG